MSAWEGAWTSVGSVATRRDAAVYQASEQHAEIAGRTYRLVVLRSSQLERKAATFEKELGKQRDELEQLGKALARQVFACSEDAESAADAWLGRAGYHRLSARVESDQLKMKREHRGRPRKDEQAPMRTVYRVIPNIEGRDAPKVEMEQQRRSTFVLITTVPVDGAGARDLVLEYKCQGSLERRFAFLKAGGFSSGTSPSTSRT